MVSGGGRWEKEGGEVLLTMTDAGLRWTTESGTAGNEGKRPEETGEAKAECYGKLRI